MGILQGVILWLAFEVGDTCWRRVSNRFFPRCSTWVANKILASMEARSLWSKKYIGTLHVPWIFLTEKQVGLQYCLTWSFYIKLHQYSICLLQNLHKKVTSKPTSQPHYPHHKHLQEYEERNAEQNLPVTDTAWQRRTERRGERPPNKYHCKAPTLFLLKKKPGGRSLLGKPVDKRWDINISFCNRGWIWMCYLYVVNHDLRYPHCPRFEASPPPNCNLEPQAVNGLFEGIASTMVLLYAFWSLGVKVSLEQNSIFCLLS